jgi:acyl-CoA thioesterase-1
LVLSFILTGVWNSAEAQIVAFGASNVAGWNVAAAEAFPAQLRSMLRAKGYSVTVINAGISGNTTTDMRKRMEADIPAGTTIVILDESGGYFNDSLNGISHEQGLADMDAIAARLKARGITIVQINFSGLPAQYRQQDGTHLTPEGHRFVAAQLLAQVVQTLGPPVPATPPDVVHACAADARRLCADVLGDAARRHACMREHRADLSKDCRAAIVRSRQGD